MEAVLGCPNFNGFVVEELRLQGQKVAAPQKTCDHLRTVEHCLSLCKEAFHLSCKMLELRVHSKDSGHKPSKTWQTGCSQAG